MQFDIFGAPRVVDDAGARRLGPEFEPLEDGTIVLFVARAFFTAVACALLAAGTRPFFLKGFSDSCSASRWCNDAAAWSPFPVGRTPSPPCPRPRGSAETYPFGVIVELRPARVEDGSPFQDKLLVLPALQVQFTPLHPAGMVAEYGDETAEDGAVNLFFPCVQILLFRDLVGRGECRVRLDLAVVENILGVPESHGVPQFAIPARIWRTLPFSAVARYSELVRG